VLELEQEFEQLTSSRSWRLTAPLRRLNRLRNGVGERRSQSTAPERRWD
jgi:hypothetical protein